jgi:hypothetical protein
LLEVEPQKVLDLLMRFEQNSGVGLATADARRVRAALL